jgi:hypothetical protein
VFDGEAFGQQMVEIVRGYVAGEIEPIKAENAALRREIEELKARPAPEVEKGDPGKDCDMAAVDQRLAELVTAAVEALPKAKDGNDGIGLANALKDEHGHLVLVMTNGDTKDLGKIDGKDGDPGKDGLNASDFDINVMPDGRTLEFGLTQSETKYVFELAFPFPMYRGVWEEKGAYEKGDMTTWAGSLWHCDDPKGLKPGDPDSGWTLAAKKGRDAK